MQKQHTFAEMLTALEQTRLPPKEHFARLVDIGLINAEGRVTKIYGGEVEPEAYAKSLPQVAK